ncbi:hypothetical protein [Kordiimonas sp.]|uniref:hypothetical protein n=1 Tax=Kordiimonas sp. TaxID=1970157 RepID=UPI003A8FF293
MSVTRTTQTPPYADLGALLMTSPTDKGSTPSTVQEKMAVNSHMSWLTSVLNKSFKPSASAVSYFRIFAQEEGQFDTVRGGYMVDMDHIVTASSKYVLSISTTAIPVSSEVTVVKQAEATAHALFNWPPRTEAPFDELGTDGAVHYGIRQVSKPMPLGTKSKEERYWPSWEESLAWWCDGQTASFIFTKAPGGPTQELITPGEDANQYWFTPAPKSR